MRQKLELWNGRLHNPWLVRIAIVFAVLCAAGDFLLLAARSSKPEASASSAWTANSNPRPLYHGHGSRAVYDRIADEVDCAEVQDEYRVASSHGHTDYMEWADYQLHNLGCYG